MKPTRIEPMKLKPRTCRWELYMRDRMAFEACNDFHREQPTLRSLSLFGKGQRQIKAGRE